MTKGVAIEIPVPRFFLLKGRAATQSDNRPWLRSRAACSSAGVPGRGEGRGRGRWVQECSGSVPAGVLSSPCRGGQFTGNFCARELKKQFYVTVVDAKEYFEYTPGVLRAFVKPAHLDSLTFTLQPVLERKMGVKFIWGEVKELNGDKKTASIKTMFSNNMDEIGFDYCIICSGCNFGPFKPMGESLWFPTVHEEARALSDWKHIDERFLEGRRRHVLEEYQKLQELNKKKATVLVVGAGFIGVEWATELEHFFPDLKLTIIDFLPRCLGPLPDSAAEYCSEYMNATGIKEFYNCGYDPKSQDLQGTHNFTHTHTQSSGSH